MRTGFRRRRPGFRGARVSHPPPALLPETEASFEQGLCAGCGKPAALCVCADLDSVDNRLFVLILQHPQEQDRDLGTARLLQKQLAQSRLVIGLSWPGLAAALGREAEPRRWATLHLGAIPVAGAASSGTLRSPLVFVDAKGGPLPERQGAHPPLDGIILLDGSWQQAKALWWRNPWLLRTRRIRLDPDFRSLYGKFRREPRRESLSTLEAGALCLSILEDRSEILPRLLHPFHALLAKYAALTRPAEAREALPATPVAKPETPG
jgi:DTW domain-containing protein